MIPIISTVTVIVTMTVTGIRTIILRKKSVFPNKLKRNNTNSRVKHKTKKSKVILIRMMIIIIIILIIVVIIIIIHLKMKITQDTSITQKIRCSSLGIVFSKT